MSQELIILQKIMDMMEYGYLALAQYPKGEVCAGHRHQAQHGHAGARHRSTKEILQEDDAAGA